MADAADENAALAIEAMYQLAANPEHWEQLVEALPDAGHDPDADAVRNLAHSEDIARLVSRPDEGPQANRASRNDVGFVILSATRKITAANSAAEAVMADGLGRLQIGRDIAFDDPENAEALHRAIDQARAQPHGQTILKLERDDDDGPRFAYVAPARTLPGVVDAAVVELAADDQAFAIVFPAVEETGRLWASIRESFGLTAAEVRLAKKLRDGRALKEAADDLDVSVNTVRNQLRAIFDKMGLKRQSELIRALTELSSLANAIDAEAPVVGLFVSADTPPVLSITLADGRRLAFREYGDPAGRPLLNFHEGMGSSLMPSGTHSLARDLGLRLICAERPGFGQSDPRTDYSFDGVADDMVALCDALGLGQLRLAALLSGAPSAIETAIRLGPRALRVDLYSGRPPRPVEGARNALTMFRTRIENNPWIVETLFAVLRLRMSRGVVERIVRRSCAHSPADLAFVEARPEVLDFVAGYVGEALARSSRGPADEIRAFRRGRNQSVADLRTPVVVWHGEEDVFAPLADLLAFLGDRATEVRVKPGIGHLLALKHWEDLLRDAAA